MAQIQAHWTPFQTRSWFQTWALTLEVSEKLRRKKSAKLWAESYRRKSRKYQWARIRTCSSINKEFKSAKWETINRPHSIMNWSIQLLTQIFSLIRSPQTSSMIFKVQDALYKRIKAHLLKSNCHRKCNTKARKLITTLTETLPFDKANKATNRWRSWSTKWS